MSEMFLALRVDGSQSLGRGGGKRWMHSEILLFGISNKVEGNIEAC